MYPDDFYDRLKVDKSIAHNTGFNPYYSRLQSGLTDPIVIEDKEFINLASNNYLGLAADERVKTGAIEAIERYGVSLCGTPVATGYLELYCKLEEKLSEFLGLESTVILPSCYQANNGLFCAIAGKEDIILVDHYAHSSLIQGIKAVGCKVRPFLHNNIEHLEQILARCTQYRQIFVVTESVFSTEGSIAPLIEITALAAKYNAIPVVDDSHGIGVIGKTGRGILEESGIKNFDGIYTASLGKALANTGGVIGGKKGIIEYLKYYCAHLVYSTALPPPVLGGIYKVLEIIEEEFGEINYRILKYKDAISNALIESGFELTNSKAPIISIITGEAENTVLLAKKFFDCKVLTTPFIEPSVPVNEGRVRLIAGANLKEESVDKAVKIIHGLGCKK